MADVGVGSLSRSLTVCPKLNPFLSRRLSNKALEREDLIKDIMALKGGGAGEVDGNKDFTDRFANYSIWQIH